jgi:hypothetical protein
VSEGWVKIADERGDRHMFCVGRAMAQWEASLKRPDLSEKDRIRGALEAYNRQWIALELVDAALPPAPSNTPTVDHANHTGSAE